MSGGVRLFATFVLANALGAVVAATPSTQSDSVLNFSAAELRRIQRLGPWPPGSPSDPGNRLSGHPQAIALGQLLFFNSRLSPQGDMSCATCHNPSQAFADARPRATGREPLERNTPSLWNAGFERWHGWDGAADSAWSQAIRALTNPREMASTAEHVTRAIAGDVELTCRWRKLFGSDAAVDPQRTLVNAAKVLGAFSTSLVSAVTPFDDFRDALAAGNAARAARYPLAAQRGLQLFVGRGQCVLCHSGPLFSNGEFGDIGMPFFVRPGEVDPGRHGGIQALQASAYNLLSQWADRLASEKNSPPTTHDGAIKTRHVELQHRNFGEFKVPSLRNVAHTAPYMHDGQLATLEQVVQHYSTLNVERLHADGEQILKPLALNPTERADLLAFLDSLSDSRASQWQPKRLAACK